MRDASEETRVRALVLVYPLPLEVIGQGSGVDHVETLGVFDLSAQGLELNYAVLGLDVWLFLAVGRRSQLEVANRALGLSVELEDQLFLVWVEVFDGDDQQSFISLFHLSGREPNGKYFIAVGIDGSRVRRDSEESRVDFS